MTHAFMPSRGRGRPKKAPVPSQDTGTPELIFKRAYDETAEAIDLCRARNLITDEQHRAGMHLRWLHTIRFGAPGVSAYDLTRASGAELRAANDLLWHRAREEEYQDAIELLRTVKRLDDVMGVCVYNERPFYLKREWLHRAYDDRYVAARIERAICHLQDGLDTLVHGWKKSH